MTEMPAAEPPRPRNRMVTRFLTELQLTTRDAILDPFGGDFAAGILFLVIARRSALVGEGAISINALANSMTRPFETTRRQVAALVDAGLVVRTRQGVAVPRETLARPAFATLLASMHDALARFAEDMRRFDVPLPPTRAGVEYDRAAGEIAAIDAFVSSIEQFTSYFGNWQYGSLVIAIMAANARPFLYHPDLAVRYGEANSPPPQALRTPARLNRIAAALRIPYPSARRYAEHLRAAGRIARRDDGWVVTEEWMVEPRLLATSRAVAEHVAQVLIRLSLRGFDFADPARCYIVGRPPLLDLG